MIRLKQFYINIFILFLITGCVTTPKMYKVSGSNFLQSAFQKAIDDSGLSTNLGIKIVSLKNNNTLYELNANSLFNPASNTKLYTCISALALLDTGYTFTTSIFQENNNLYLVGGGDPDLTLNSLDSLARVISEKLNKIDTLFLDESLMDTQRFGEGWMWDEGPWKYAAQISALSVNDNCVDFYIRPTTLGSPVNYTTNPKTEYIMINNQSLTVNDTTGFIDFKIDRNWANSTNDFTISGMVMDTSAADTFSRNIDDPTAFTGFVFKEMLSNHGREINNIFKREYSGNGRLLVSHTSKPLIVTLDNLMKESDNLTAELLVKLIGHEATDTTGTWQNGLTAIKTFLHNEVDLDTTTFYMSDGSGVSRYNYSSPEHFIQLLSWAYNTNQIWGNLISILPGGGVGTLKNRMNGKNGNRIIAKTGSLSGVSCLSGYVFTKSGEPLVFSILMNGFIGKTKPYRNLQDKITTILAEL